MSAPQQAAWKRWVLIRRSIADPPERTAYLVYTPAQTVRAEMVHVAEMRWTVEESLQTATGEVGLDHYEVRSWTGWYRHITLAMWAQAFLAVVRAATGTDVAPKKGGRRRTTTSLARFKAHRGLRSARAGPKSADCSGSSWLEENGVRHASCSGRGGAGGIKPGPAIITTASGRGKCHRQTSKKKRRSRPR